MSLSGVDGLEDLDPDAVIYSWTKRAQTYDTAGDLVVTETPCGDTKPELCGAPTAFAFISPEYDFSNESYAQYIPNQVWGTAGQHTIASMSLPNAIPGAALVTPPSAEILGIHLTDPLGQWPSMRSRVAASAGQVTNTNTNGAYWLNEDGDTKLGVTSLAVPPNGITDNNAGNDDPPINYGPLSSVCPRADTTKHWAYDYWPAQEGLNVRRVRRFYVASRVVKHLVGTIDTCDRSTGTVRGRTATDQMSTDARFYGCEQSNGTDCNAAITDFYDTAAQTQMITGSTYVMERMTTPGSITCDQVRDQLPVS